MKSPSVNVDSAAAGKPTVTHTYTKGLRPCCSNTFNSMIVCLDMMMKLVVHEDRSDAWRHTLCVCTLADCET